jgi:hypothetical protein
MKKGFRTGSFEDKMILMIKSICTFEVLDEEKIHIERIRITLAFYKKRMG